MFKEPHNLPADLMTRCGQKATIYSKSNIFLFGFIDNIQTPSAWYITDGEHVTGGSALGLVPAFCPDTELAKLENHNLAALTAFVALQKKINGIKFLREVQKAAGRPSDLPECKMMYERFAITNKTAAYWRQGM